MNPTIPNVSEWFAAQVADGWFSCPPVISCDRDEILVVGALTADVDPSEFRERTREARMQIAREAEALFGRKVSWGVKSGDATLLYTHLSIPIMTRLRQPERSVLDALITGGIAKSRSEALAWCVALVGQHQSDWLQELVDAAEAVRKVRERGPK